MRIATLAAGLMESALARLIAFHPEPAPLSQWQGQVVKLSLNELPGPFYLLLIDPIQVYSQYEGPIDAELRLGLDTLSQLSQGASLSQLVNQGQLEIQGDMALVGKLAAMLGAIEPDLADPLSKLVGDAMAYRLDQGGRHLVDSLQRNLVRLHQHTGEVLREELRLAPCQREVAHFAKQVDSLTEQAQQLDSRLKQLESQS